MIRKNHAGEKYGKLTILKFSKYMSPDKREDAAWLCICDCGEKKVVRYRTLRNGNTKTCGLCNKFIGNKHREWKGFGEISKDLFNTYRHSAIARNLEFNITIEQIWKLFLKQKRKCALTGWHLYFPISYKTKSDKTASLDRIDSQKGYTINNVQWVHRDVNKLKKNLDNEYFLEICCAISEYKEN